MQIREVQASEKNAFNAVVTHPLQSFEWGEFREKTGLEVIRLGLFDGKTLNAGFQITLHPIPKLNYKIGYLPKCILPNLQVLQALKEVGKLNNCLFIKIEPNAKAGKDILLKNGCIYGRPLFTKYTFQLDLTQSEEILLAKMKPKTRYNLRLAQRKGVTITNNDSNASFEDYLKLTMETTKRQKFYAHDEKYHRNLFQVLKPTGMVHLLQACYQNRVLVSWMVFNFNKVLYYPYGASTREDRKVMASNLMMWEAIRFGKKLGCQTFDLWGSLGPNPNPADPWYGFHRFKEGYSPKLIEFIGTYDLVINYKLYKLYNLIDSLRWQWLKLKSLFF